MCVHQTLPRVSFSRSLGAERERAPGAELAGHPSPGADVGVCTPLAHLCVPPTAAAYGGKSPHFSPAFAAHGGVFAPWQVAGEIRQHALQLLVATAGGSRAMLSRAVQLKCLNQW